MHLHVGLAKTGTTAVREALHANREWFAARGVLVPRTGFGRVDAHRELVAELGQGSTTGQATSRLREELRAHPGLDVLISQETLGVLDSRAGVALHALCALALESGRRPRVVLVVRNPIDLIQSQLLKNIADDRLQPGDLIAAHQAAVDLSPATWRLLWSAAAWPALVLTELRRRLGPVELDLSPYRSGVESVDTVMGATGVSMDESFCRPRRRSNPSFPIEAVAAVAARPPATTVEEHRRLLDSLPGVEGSTAFLHRTTRAVLWQRIGPWYRRLVADRPHLAPILKSSTAALPELDRAVVEAAEDRLRFLERHPTVLAEDQPTGPALFDRLQLDGWEPSPDGARSRVGTTSIRCRFHRAHLGAYGERVLVMLRPGPGETPTLSVSLDDSPPRRYEPATDVLVLDADGLVERDCVATITLGGDEPWTLTGFEWSVLDGSPDRAPLAGPLEVRRNHLRPRSASERSSAAGEQTPAPATWA